MDFSTTYTQNNVYSNLGGRGPDNADTSKCFTAGDSTCKGLLTAKTGNRACCMNYPQVGQTSDGTNVDLIVEVVDPDEYNTNVNTKNGFEAGGFGRFNLKGNSNLEPEMLFSFVVTGTQDLVTPPPTVIKFTFFDLDARCSQVDSNSAPGNCDATEWSLRETITVSAGGQYGRTGPAILTNPNQLFTTSSCSTGSGDCTVKATREANQEIAGPSGYGANPSSPQSLTNEQKQTSVGFEFHDTAQFKVKFNLEGTDDSSNGRNIFFAGSSSLTDDFCD